jgi:hypothetical protein
VPTRTARLVDPGGDRVATPTTYTAIITQYRVVPVARSLSVPIQ